MALRSLPPETAQQVLYDWRFWARDNQLAPDWSWRKWLILAGRGYGKTRSGAEWIGECVDQGRSRRIALVSKTPASARDEMIEGESGFLNISPPWRYPKYEPSKRRLTWPNGAVALIASSWEPDILRGPQFDTAWCLTGESEVTMGEGGHRPIKSIRPGHYVQTRVGPRQVQAVSRRRKVIGTIRLADGSHLTGTADHRVLQSHGWTALADLRLGSIVWGAQSEANSRSVSSNLKTSIGSSTHLVMPRAGLTDSRSSVVGLRGNRSTGLSLRDAISITLMATEPMMQYPTFDWLQRLPTRLSTDANTLPSALIAGTSSPAAVDSEPLSAKAVSINALRRSERLSDDVSGVGLPSYPGVAVSAASVVSTWEPAGIETVYDLQIQGVHEFIANGIIVHNCDEVGAWKYPRETYDNLMLGLRLGDDPRCVITTTPKPIQLLRELLSDPTTAVTRGSTYENRANLAGAFFDEVVARYEGTRTGRQEIYAELLDEAEGALWKRDWFESHRCIEAPELNRVVVAIDPAVTNTEESNETGIICCGTSKERHGYVLGDSSGRYSPKGWAEAAITLFKRHHADRIVAEVNNGGDMVESTLRNIWSGVPYEAVHATRGKVVRAEPVATVYEQRRIHHVGRFDELEDQLVQWEPGMPSPDRLDALVWGFTALAKYLITGSRIGLYTG